MPFHSGSSTSIYYEQTGSGADLVWVGGGDGVTFTEGCLHERTVEFELPFKSRLEMISSARSRAVEGRPCPAPSSMQETLPMKAVSLVRGRTLPP